MARKRKAGALRPRGDALPTRDMDKPAQRWLAKTARAQHWRVQNWMGLDDLLQDGGMCWQIVLTKYPTVRDPKRLMALFKRVYTNHLHKLANRRTATPEYTIAMDDYTQALERDYAQAEQLLVDSHAELLTFFAEAPPPVQRLLCVMHHDPAILAQPIPRNRHGRRLSTNQWLCSLIDLDPQAIDLAAMLNGFLGRAT